MNRYPKIIGKSEYEIEVKDILGNIDLDFSQTTLVLDDTLVSTDNVVCQKKSEASQNSLTYSMTDNSADVVVLNVQNHSENKSFEILYGAEMGRVFIDHEKNCSVNAVLMAAAVMINGGYGFGQVVKTMNGILK